MPGLAWHAAGELARSAGPGKPDAGQPDLASTIDAPLQAQLEALARRTADAQGPTAQVALLVVQIDNRAVRAAVGSAGLDRPGGWIDLTRALPLAGLRAQALRLRHGVRAGRSRPGHPGGRRPGRLRRLPSARFRPQLPGRGHRAPSAASLLERAGGEDAGGGGAERVRATPALSRRSHVAPQGRARRPEPGARARRRGREPAQRGQPLRRARRRRGRQAAGLDGGRRPRPSAGRAPRQRRRRRAGARHPAREPAARRPGLAAARERCRGRGRAPSPSRPAPPTASAMRWRRGWAAAMRWRSGRAAPTAAAARA